MKRFLFGMTACAALAALFVSQVESQPPPGGKDGKGGDKGAKAPPRFELGQVFPPPLVEELQLTPQQEKELESIKADLKVKLDKLLTADQKKVIENFRPRGPGGPGGPGEKGGPGGPGGPGGKGPQGEKGGKDGDRPERPPVEKNP